MPVNLRSIVLSFASIPLLALTTPGIGRAASCHVITANGGGTNSGADWSNPCNGFTGNCAGSAMVHGDTYYVAGGSGGGYSNTSTTGHVVDITSTGANPSLPLAVKAATVADHCTNTGWNAATMAVDGGAGQAIFTSVSPNAVALDTPNAIVDGNFAASDTSSSWGNPGHACAGTQCGIKVDFSTASAFQLGHFMWPFFVGDGASNGTIRSIEFVGCGSVCGSQGEYTDAVHLSPNTPPSNTLVSHGYWHDSSQGYISGSNETGTTVKYNYFLRNYSHSVSPAVHGYIWSPHGGSNQVFAFNVVRDCGGTAVIDEVNSGVAATNTNFQFYGNLIWMSSGNPSGTGNYGNGIVSCTNGDTCINWQMYNNTIANLNPSTNNTLTGGNPTGSGSSMKELNNLFWNSTPAASGSTCGTTTTCVTDYDYFSNTTHTAQSHEQATSSNPFVNWTAGDFHLIANTNSGAVLGAPFNVDPDGLVRSGSRGAFQFGTGSSSLPASPTLLTATVQ